MQSRALDGLPSRKRSSGAGHPDAHTEIHRPLLVASGRQVGPQVISTLIARPSAPTQTDRADNKPLLDHLKVELARKIATDLLSDIVCFGECPTYDVGFHVSVDPFPFRGSHTFSYTLRPPTPRPASDASILMSYHIVERPGVNVAVQPAADHVTVDVSMNEGSYKPAKLPTAHNCHYDTGALGIPGVTDIGPLLLEATSHFNFDPTGLARAISGGVTGTCYDQIPAPPDPSTLPADQQIVVDGAADQPWPVYGFISVRWTPRPTVITDPATNVTPTSATLNGRINPQGRFAYYHFDWGTTTNYGNRAPAVDPYVGSDIADHALSLHVPRACAGYDLSLPARRARARRNCGTTRPSLLHHHPPGCPPSRSRVRWTRAIGCKPRRTSLRTRETLMAHH